MKNVCRTCLRSQKDLIPLYGNQKIIDKIRTISQIEITEGANYPSKICQECIANINKFYNFYTVLKNCDYELKNRYNFKSYGIKITKTKSVLYDSEDEKPLIYIKTELDQKILNKTAWSPEPENDINFFEKTEDHSNPEDNLSDYQKEKKNTFIIGSRLHPKKYSCSECKLEFTSRFKLYNHKRTVHVVPGICNICGLVVRADNLRRHVAMHSEGPAVCKECGKTFKNSESLRGHMLIHRGHIFTCEKCGKTSKVRAEHRRHMKTHLDPEVGKIVCTICGKKVRDLRKHMHSHTGARPHLCNYCEKGFTSPYALKVHTRQHTNEKPFVCPVCSLGYPQKVSLVTHMKSRHNAVFLEAVKTTTFTKNETPNDMDYIDNLTFPTKNESEVTY